MVTEVSKQAEGWALKKAASQQRNFPTTLVRSTDSSNLVISPNQQFLILAFIDLFKCGQSSLWAWLKTGVVI
jgi:hypothetical protein